MSPEAPTSASLGAAPRDLARALQALRAADDFAAPDREIAHLAALDDWLAADPGTYFHKIEELGARRLRTQQSADLLAAAVASLSEALRGRRIAPFTCGEALQVCIADLALLEELDDTDVPPAAVTALRRDLVPESVDLVRRIMRNLTLRRQPPDAPPTGVGTLQAALLARRAGASRTPPARFKPDRPALIIATAGRGTRLRSTIPKGLIPVGGVPMIEHAIRAADEAGLCQKVFVLRYRADTQHDYLSRRGHVVVQESAEGNGHSTYAGLAALPSWRAPVLLAYSDCPFLGVDSFRRLIEQPLGQAEALRLSTYSPARETAGRIVRDEMGEIERIDQPRVTDVSVDEADGGLYATSYVSVYPALGGITNDNTRGEYQFTDVIARLRATGHSVTAVPGPAEDFQSVDAPPDLIMARLRLATGAKTNAELNDPALAPRILSFLSEYGLRGANGSGGGERRMAELHDIAMHAVAAARELVGPLLDLSSDW